MSVAGTARAHLGRSGRFAVVGTSGVLANMLVLYLLAHGLQLPKVPAAALATEAGTLNNFLLHDRWTYADSHPNRSLFGRIVRFHASTLVGAGLALLVFTALVNGLSFHYLVANLVGIGAAACWYYVANAHFIWAPPSAGSPR